MTGPQVNYAPEICIVPENQGAKITILANNDSFLIPR